MHVWAVPFPQVLKLDHVASSGRCVIPAVNSPREADQVLRVHNISTEGAKPEERISLASGVAHAAALAGGNAAFVKDSFFTFETRSGYSRYAGVSRGKHQLQMNRCLATGLKCKPNNVAHLMHEMGHRVGHYRASGGRFYDAYEKLGIKCHITSYSRKNMREEFAEVFAAFITRPELLTSGSSACKKAFKFFAESVFRVDKSLVSCDSRPLRTLMARYQSAQPTMVAAAPRATRVATAESVPAAPRVRARQETRPEPAASERPARVATAEPVATPSPSVSPRSTRPAATRPAVVVPQPPVQTARRTPPNFRPTTPPNFASRDPIAPAQRPPAARPPNSTAFNVWGDEEEFYQEAQVATASFRGWPW